MSKQTDVLCSDIMYVRTLCAWYTGAGALSGRGTWMVAMAAMATRLGGEMVRWRSGEVGRRWGTRGEVGCLFSSGSDARNEGEGRESRVKRAAVAV